MKPELECAPCFFKWVYERAGVLANKEKRFQLNRRLLALLSQEVHPGANLGSITNKTIRAIDEFMQETAGYYQRFKQKSNRLAKELLPTARKFIEKGKRQEENLTRACLLASASNVAPIGAPGAFKFEEVIEIVRGRRPPPILRGNLFKTLERAKEVLYIADNAGEIGFDSLLISKLRDMGSKVTLLVKEDPFFEDATTTDALYFAMDELVDNLLTVNGFFVPGQDTSQVSDAFGKSDLLIAKGTGNYEALKGELRGKKAIYLLKVKCKPVAANIGAPVGTFVAKAEK